MKRMPDGTVISSYFDLEQTPKGSDLVADGMKLVVGQIARIHFTDDKANLSQKYVEYDVLVKDSKAGLIQFKNVRKAELEGSFNDYSEHVLEPSEFAIKGKLEDSNTFKNKTGTIVVLAFIDGMKDKPIILMALPHPLLDGAKKADGVRKKGEFRGVQWEINKDGELILTHQGPRSNDGKLKSKDKVLTVVKFDKEGNLTITDHSKDQIKLDNTNTKILIASGDKGTQTEIDGKNDKIITSTAKGLKTEMDGPGDKMTITTAGGLKVELDGSGDKAVFTTLGGPKITLDGANKIILEAGATKITIDGSSGKISIDGSLVDVGTAASALATLGPQLIAWLTSHNHISPFLGLPTSPPIVPPPISTLSTSVKVKA